MMQSVFGIALLGTPLKSKNVSLINLKYIECVFDNADTSYRIIPAPGNTYGYEILVGNKVLICQRNIPGRAGNLGFKKKSDAKKAALLMLKKLSQGIMPPTIERHELEELKIDY